MRDFATARLLALIVPGALVGGALVSQYGFGLYPCEMCLWQRWPHYAAVVLALLAFVLGQRSASRGLVALAALLIAVSGAIGVFHAGVEYHWWEGLTRCATSGAITVEDIMNAPLIRCDAAAWRLFGISLAGYNAIFSFLGAAAIFAFLRRSAQAPAR